MQTLQLCLILGLSHLNVTIFSLDLFSLNLISLVLSVSLQLLEHPLVLILPLDELSDKSLLLADSDLGLSAQFLLFILKDFELQGQPTDLIRDTGYFMKVAFLDQFFKTLFCNKVKLLGRPVLLKDLGDLLLSFSNVISCQQLRANFGVSRELSLSDGRVAEQVELHVARCIMPTLEFHVDLVFFARAT